mmetsp:Transcript_1151/g.3046  ORF Transcript_1151/g.3046 Transcript_1151/m.3046 type:complete len:271 (-) Transcript_1151:358-1170(-)
MACPLLKGARRLYFSKAPLLEVSRTGLAPRTEFLEVAPPGGRAPARGTGELRTLARRTLGLHTLGLSPPRLSDLWTAGWLRSSVAAAASAAAAAARCHPPPASAVGAPPQSTRSGQSRLLASARGARASAPRGWGPRRFSIHRHPQWNPSQCHSPPPSPPHPQCAQGGRCSRPPGQTDSHVRTCPQCQCPLPCAQARAASCALLCVPQRPPAQLQSRRGAHTQPGQSAPRPAPSPRWRWHHWPWRCGRRRPRVAARLRAGARALAMGRPM